MDKIMRALNAVGITSNKTGDKLEQKQSRAIKNELSVAFLNFAKALDLEVMYENDSPVIVFDNGLIVGFDFVVKPLNLELNIAPQPKPKKADK
jgi:hypothetical protein